MEENDNSRQIERACVMLRRAIEGGHCSYPALDMDPFFASLCFSPGEPV